MTGIPRAAVLWGALGLVPFLYGAAMVLAEPTMLPGLGVFEPGAAGGVLILERFGTAILAFMGGCLWGFSSSGREPSFLLLGGSAIPSFIAFSALWFSPTLSCIWLAFGYVILQGLDIAYVRAGVAPSYWLSLRLPLTALVMTCLLVGTLYG